MISMEGAQLTKAVFSGGLNHRKRKIRSDVAKLATRTRVNSSYRRINRCIFSWKLNLSIKRCLRRTKKSNI